MITTIGEYPSLASAVLKSFRFPVEDFQLAEKLASLVHCIEVESVDASIKTVAESGTGNLEYILELYITLDKRIESAEGMSAYLKEKEIDAGPVEPMDENYVVRGLYLLAYFDVSTKS